MMKTPRLSQSLQMNVDFDATFAITVSEPRVRDPDFPRSTQSPFEGKQDMKHTTPPLDYSGLPNTDAEFQKYKGCSHRRLLHHESPHRIEIRSRYPRPRPA